MDHDVLKRLLFPLTPLLTAALVLAACSDGDGSGSSGDLDPAEVVEGYVSAYNAQDIDRVMTFFADDAVIIEGAEGIEGAAAIRAGELAKFEVHAPGGEAYSISNLVVTGDTATWDHVFEGTAHTCVGTGDEAWSRTEGS